VVAGYKPDEVTYDGKLSQDTSEGESFTMFDTNKVTNVIMMHRVTSDGGRGETKCGEPSCEM
jgi:hypothetical protein